MKSPSYRKCKGISSIVNNFNDSYAFEVLYTNNTEHYHKKSYAGLAWLSGQSAWLVAINGYK